MDNYLKQNALVEDALKSQPLAPMPRSITLDVMLHIQKDARPPLLAWTDLGLSFVVAACIAALWFATQSLPPIVLAKLRIQGILLYQDFLVNADWLIPAGMFGLTILLLIIMIPTLIQLTTNRRG